MLDRSSTRYVILLYVCDIVLTMAALVLAAAVRPILPFGKELGEPGGTLNPSIFATAAIVWSVVLAMASAYDARQIMKASGEIKAVFVGVSQSMLILTGFLYMTFRGLSRLLFVTFYVFDLLLILAVRMALRIAFKWNRSPVKGNRVLIIGTDKVAASVGERVAELRWMGLELAGYVTGNGGQEESTGADPESQQTNGAGPLNAPILGTLQTVPDLIKQAGISEMIIALPLRDHNELPNLVAQWSSLPVNIKVVPDFFDLAVFRSRTEILGDMPLIGIKEPVLSPSGRLTKRILDLLISGLALTLLSPFLALIAILIKLDSPGPVIFRQERAGESGRLFWMYKLRTMVADAAEQQGTLMRRDDQGNVIFEKKPDDPRVTRLGRFLRRFSLDETPQFVNVIKGEMSLVGPRPELPVIVENYQPWQRKRFAVPPGMTGWWQVRGRSQQPMNMRTEDDLYYIQNYSLLLDLQIMWKTIGAVITGRGAY
jgi:exopolysaccharide biosynthesis polyprenyl glycosylphosphotransferase